jgi:hypothetical protein
MREAKEKECYNYIFDIALSNTTLGFFLSLNLFLSIFFANVTIGALVTHTLIISIDVMNDDFDHELLHLLQD